MPGSKENTLHESKADFIRYLYNEGIRKGVHRNPSFYPEILKFIETDTGKEAFRKFSCIEPYRLGITVSSTQTTLKRAFQ